MQNLQLYNTESYTKKHIQNSWCKMDSWDYEENLDLIEYMPKKNNYLDIWQYGVGMTLLDYHLNWPEGRVQQNLISKRAFSTTKISMNTSRK